MQKLSGFGFRGFRSYYGTLQVLPSLSDVNLIAGQNNSGKSNILRVLARMNEMIKHGIDGLDLPRKSPSPNLELTIRLGDRASVTGEFCNFIGKTGNDAMKTVNAILANHSFDRYRDNGVWLNYSLDSGELSVQAQRLDLADSADNLYTFARLAGTTTYSDFAPNAAGFMASLQNYVKIPSVHTIEASRRVDDALIARLAALQHPDLDRDAEDRPRFTAINRFIQTVTGYPGASLEVPESKSDVYVRRGDLLLPLDNLGSGIAQVILLAALASVQTESMICIEEPEVHLHPVLQRKLLRYLKYETDNQYFIATHSAQLLDSTIATIYHVDLTELGSRVSLATTPAQLSEICYDLGYRPSDLLQTNCVIWVEGPSDRRYITRWLRIMAPNLREGIDYSVMFYGGALLSHLSTDDPEPGDVEEVVNEFISLRKLNRHIAMVIDSDKSAAEDPINDTKKRIGDEICRGGNAGYVWVTQGRYIENYVPPAALLDVLKTRYPRKNFNNQGDIFADIMRPVGTDSKFRPLKVKIAEDVCDRWSEGLDHLDLYDKIQELADFIEQANGHPSLARPNRAAPEFKGP